MFSRRLALTGAAASVLLVGCTASPPAPPVAGASDTPRADPRRHQVIARLPERDVALPVGPHAGIEASRALLAVATAVVVVDPASPAERVALGAQAARALGLPLLESGPELAAELDRLQTRTVVSYAPDAAVGGREVVAGPDDPATLSIDGLPVRAQAPATLVFAVAEPSPALEATLAAAGLTATALPYPHPGATAASTKAVREHPGPVVALGGRFGTDATLAAAVAAARTVPELPGGGIVPFPRRRMVALYGHPATGSLGMMGEQPPAQAVARVQRLAAEYQELLPDDQVIGAFEIITTVASGSATSDGDYSYETPVADLLPWIEAAEAAGLYVVLDLQPGRTDFLTQAQRYSELLRRPYVGLALDPEWRLKPNEKHLVSVGQVGVDEVNRVGTWLADLVRDHRLPPKVLTLHQFQVRMVTERARLDTSRPEIQWLVHVDGQGGQAAKQATWSVLQKGLPEHVFLGWKNFEHEDLPMLTPRQTVDQVKPTPHFISYQ